MYTACTCTPSAAPAVTGRLVAFTPVAATAATSHAPDTAITTCRGILRQRLLVLQLLLAAGAGAAATWTASTPSASATAATATALASTASAAAAGSSGCYYCS